MRATQPYVNAMLGGSSNQIRFQALRTSFHMNSKSPKRCHIEDRTAMVDYNIDISHPVVVFNLYSKLYDVTLTYKGRALNGSTPRSTTSSEYLKLVSSRYLQSRQKFAYQPTRSLNHLGVRVRTDGDSPILGCVYPYNSYKIKKRTYNASGTVKHGTRE